MSVKAVLTQGTTLHIEGSAAAAEVLTAIVTGFPTILAITGHDGAANGDVVTLAGFTGADAAVLNSKQFVVKNYATGATNDTFAIEVNTVGKTITIDAGNTTATPTAWIKVGEVTNLDGSSSAAPDIEVTDLSSTQKEYRVGLADPGTVSMEAYCVDDDPGLAAMEASFNAASVKNYKITYPEGATPIRTFQASVRSFPQVGKASKDGVVTGTIELRRSGAVTKS